MHESESGPKLTSVLTAAMSVFGVDRKWLLLAPTSLLPLLRYSARGCTCVQSVREPCGEY
jgi:hypothetical protein